MLSWCRAVILHGNIIGDSAGTKNKNIHTMSSEAKDDNKADPENIITVTLDDLSEDDRREVEREVEKEMVQRRKLMLAGYQKTRNGVIKKVPVSSSSDLFSAEVKNSTKEIDHLVDVSVVSKHGSDMESIITQAVANTFEEFKERLSKDLENNLVLQINNDFSKKKLMPFENSGFLNLSSNIYTPSASASVVQPYVPLNNDQCGRNNMSISANNFSSSVASPVFSTSVLQNCSNHDRSVGFNANVQQPSYQTVAYNTSPMLPVGTGIPYGPVPDSYFSGSLLQTSHAQIPLPEFPPRACNPSAPQTIQPNGSFKDQLASILREFGLEPKCKARAHQKPSPDYFDLTPYPHGFRIPDFVKFTGEDGRTTFEHIG